MMRMRMVLMVMMMTMMMMMNNVMTTASWTSAPWTFASWIPASWTPASWTPASRTLAFWTTSPDRGSPGRGSPGRGSPGRGSSGRGSSGGGSPSGLRVLSVWVQGGVTALTVVGSCKKSFAIPTKPFLQTVKTVTPKGLCAKESGAGRRAALRFRAGLHHHIQAVAWSSCTWVVAGLLTGGPVLV